MQEDPTPRTDHPAEGVNVPYPGIKTAHDIENAEERLLNTEDELESNELHAGGRTCARCGQIIGPEEDVRRTPSGEIVHDFCPRR